MSTSSPKKPKSTLATRLQSPRISRFITERWISISGLMIFGLVTSFLVGAIILRLGELREGLIVVSVNSSRRQELLGEKSYWEDVLKRHPGYRDAAFKLAVLSLQLGQENEAKIYNDLALQIDPNFKQGRDFVKRLEQ